jgi:hypothetical protein
MVPEVLPADVAEEHPPGDRPIRGSNDELAPVGLVSVLATGGELADRQSAGNRDDTGSCLPNQGDLGVCSSSHLPYCFGI